MTVMAKSTLAVNESSKSANVQVSQENKTYITADHKKEDKAFENMNVKQKVSYLRAKQLQGDLTNPEQEQLKNLEDELGKSIDGKRNPKLKKEGSKEIEEPGDIFKEKDILDYMYNDWLLGGANWLFKKTYKGVAITTDYIADKAWAGLGAAGKGLKQGLSSKPAQQDDTTRYVTNIDKACLNFNTNNQASLDSGLDKFEAKMQRYGRGEGTDAEKQTLMYQIVEEMPARERAAFCKNMVEMAGNATNNIKTINYMASMLARTQMIQNAISQENPPQADPKLFEEMTKRNALLIAKQLDASQNPEKLMESMFKDIKKASKTVNKSLDKGKYLGNAGKKFRKKPLSNDALLKVNGLLGLDKQGGSLLQSNTNTSPQRKSLYEQLIEFQGVDNILSFNDKEIRTQMDANRMDYEAHQKRKQAYLNRIHNMMAPNVPQNLQQKKQQNQANNNLNRSLTGNGGR